MPNDRAARPAEQTASIAIPDQLQQARQADTSVSSETLASREARRDEPVEGILHELKTERAHD